MVGGHVKSLGADYRGSTQKELGGGVVLPWAACLEKRLVHTGSRRRGTSRGPRSYHLRHQFRI